VRGTGAYNTQGHNFPVLRSSALTRRLVSGAALDREYLTSSYTRLVDRACIGTEPNVRRVSLAGCVRSHTDELAMRQ